MRHALAILALVAVVMPSLHSAVAVDDIKVSQATNVSPPAYADRFTTPVAGTLWGFDANKRPVVISIGANLAIVGNVLNASGGGGGGAVDSVSGTIGEVTVTPTTGFVVVSLPSSLVFTGKTITGGTYSSATYNGVTLTGVSTPSLAVSGTSSISGTNTGDQTSVSGNAGTATALQTARLINGVSFDGTANITVTAAAGTLSGTTLAASVTASSLTSVGTIGTGTWQGSSIADAYISSAATWNAKLSPNTPITGATKTKITYDADGLVTAGADATTADIADSSNRRYVTDPQLVVIGNTSGTNTGDQTSVTGNAGTATALQTARTINGTSFDGTANITITSAAGTLTGSTLNASVTASSLTSVGTLATLTVTAPIAGSVTGSSGSTTGNAATATALQTARTINGTSFNGTANITVTAAADTLTGSSLAPGVTASSLTSAAGGTFGTAAFTAASAYEAALGNPGVNGYVLSSTTAGVRSWVAQSGGGTWGSITGTLSAQTDLQSALDAKVNLVTQSIYTTDAAGTDRGYGWQTGGLNRWRLLANSAPETGSNAGSDLFLAFYNDAGVYQGNALSFERATGVLTIQEKRLEARHNNIGATSTTSLSIKNVTPAAAGAQQWSPRIEFFGSGWKTDSGGASQSVSWIQEVRPVQGAAAPTSLFVFGSGINQPETTGTYTDRMTLSSAGLLSVTGGVAVTGTVSATGNVTITGITTMGNNSSTGTHSAIITNNDQANVRLRFNNTGPGGQIWSLVGGTPGASNAGLAIYNETAGATVAQFSSTGLAVTGAVSASSQFQLAGFRVIDQAATELRVGDILNNYSALGLYIGGTQRAALSSTGLAVTGTVSAGTVTLSQPFGTSLLRFRESGVDKWDFYAPATGILGLYNYATAGDVARFTSTGLAVTGAVSATGSLITDRPSGSDSLLFRESGVNKWSFFAPTTGSLALYSHVAGYAVATFSPAGLAVTGAVSASGDSYIGSGLVNVTTGTQDGVGFYSTGQIHVSRDANPSLLIRRRSSDGTISLFYRDTTNVGNISVTTTTTAYNTSSDARLKTNIRDFTDSGVVLDAIQPRIFDWKSGEKDSVGFVAQELYEVYPAAVTKGDDGDEITEQWAVDYSKLVPVLVAEIKDLRSRVKQLEEK